ncbi:ABC transporter permease [Candidatus Xianfuyuplasma coldseepsis]|uniref:ABC transporter permease n=2 Tax=Candidatus Xianfuyuplasma coldseepsis TaxID=2782163 RepID=A0A7L7KWD3_9MOLU|nr:ABC transporter permease [Xianfuyuplasma coldseepsis]
MNIIEKRWKHVRPILYKVVVILLTVLVYFMVYFPILVIILLSINESESGQTFTALSLKWYAEIFRNERLLTAIINTVTIALISTVVATIVGTLTAIGISSLTKSRRIQFMVLNNIPVINPDIVTGLSLMLVFSLLPISFGMPTMLLAHIFFSIPFVVLTVLPKLKELDPNLMDAALDLGCNYFQGVYKVIIPSIKTSIIAGALIAFTMSIDDFVISYFTTGNGFQNVSIWIYSRLGRRTFSPAVYAYNTLIVFVTIGVLGYINIRMNVRLKGEKK